MIGFIELIGSIELIPVFWVYRVYRVYRVDGVYRVDRADTVYRFGVWLSTLNPESCCLTSDTPTLVPQLPES